MVELEQLLNSELVEQEKRLIRVRNLELNSLKLQKEELVNKLNAALNTIAILEKVSYHAPSPSPLVTTPSTRLLSSTSHAPFLKCTSYHDNIPTVQKITPAKKKRAESSSLISSIDSPLNGKELEQYPVSYTHLTLPTIYSV
eukprot:TRINITY_DN15588_c0_g1_i2.p1 TRINITY_DN15588_c0_g1~~TRINITY_DN15588_c0_g1_i2.p1  ORF type:complete len:142 (-),score=20.98 TRINITY_DN15588_c0_g1_i2:34-459(-)